jgi:hypothetical protein
MEVDMTLPYENYNSIVNTRNFLTDLMDSKKSPKVAKAVRQRARSLLKHFPADFELCEWISTYQKVAHERYDNPRAAVIKLRKNDPVEYSPVHAGWIFWNEASTDFYGPFLSRKQCEEAFTKYGEELDLESKGKSSKSINSVMEG